MPKPQSLSEEDEELYELSENLRLQLVVLELQKKLNKYKYRRDNEAINKRYILLRTTKIVVIAIYSILVLFEKPLHCYKSTTFYTNENKADNECDPTLQYLYKGFFINEKLYRFIELIFLVSFVFLKFCHFKIKKRNLFQKVDKYIILQYIILGIIALCFLDIAICIRSDSYPLINFFLRGILIILLIKNQRNMWEIVLKIFYQTRILTFLIVCVMVFFGIVGYFLFKGKSEDFESIPLSVYTLFILLSTCNFPDVMLATFDESNKVPFFYFLLYLIINYFILFTLLKTLYYSEFFDSFKANARKAIEGVFNEFHDKENIQRMSKKFGKRTVGSVNSNYSNKSGINNENLEKAVYNDELYKSNYLIPEESRRFNKVLFNLNKKFYLTKNDYIKILKLIGYKGDVSEFTKNDIYQILNENDLDKSKTRDFIKSHSKFLKFYTNKYTEIVINIANFIIMTFLLIDFKNETVNFYFIMIPQILWCLFFIFELIVYKQHFSFQYLLVNELILISFYLINCIIFFLLLLVFIFYTMGEVIIARYFFTIVKVFITLRMARVLFLFKKYRTFETFSRTFQNMKNIFYGLISALFSFFYIFITITMFLTGGNISENSFDNNDAIPTAYANINFNDFGSGFLSCFCLTMINNINIISISLSYGHSKYYQGYFALFYFISTLVILNISTTLLLEMYMSIQSKMKEVKNKSDDNDDEEINVKEIMG